ncbi:MAG: hypothetical protein ACJA2S_002285 [Cyclobacteriaceae bacterium]
MSEGMSLDITKVVQQSIKNSKLKNPISNFNNEEIMVLYKAFDVESNKEGAIYEVDNKISKLTLSVGGFLQQCSTYSQLVNHIAKEKRSLLKQNLNQIEKRSFFLSCFNRVLN